MQRAAPTRPEIHLRLAQAPAGSSPRGRRLEPSTPPPPPARSGGRGLKKETKYTPSFTPGKRRGLERTGFRGRRGGRRLRASWQRLRPGLPGPGLRAGRPVSPQGPGARPVSAPPPLHSCFLGPGFAGGCGAGRGRGGEVGRCGRWNVLGGPQGPARGSPPLPVPDAAAVWTSWEESSSRIPPPDTHP